MRNATSPLSPEERIRLTDALVDEAALHSWDSELGSLSQNHACFSQIQVSGAAQAYLVHQPWTARAKELATQFREQDAIREYRLNKQSLTSRAAGLYIACEQQQACDAAEQFAYRRESLLDKLSSGLPVPLIYGADSGLHTAIGFAAGLKKASPQANIAISPMIGSEDTLSAALAVEAAEQSGLAIFCDAVLCYGAQCGNFLRAFPANSNVQMIAYVNNSYGDAPWYGNPRIEAWPSLVKQAPVKNDFFFLTSLVGTMGHAGFDPVNRGDVIACVEGPYTTPLRPLLLRRDLNALNH